MSDKETVLEKCSDARAVAYPAGFSGNLAVKIVGYGGRGWLGSGHTEPEAWADAAHRLDCVSNEKEPK